MKAKRFELLLAEETGGFAKGGHEPLVVASRPTGWLPCVPSEPWRRKFQPWRR